MYRPTDLREHRAERPHRLREHPLFAGLALIAFGLVASAANLTQSRLLGLAFLTAIGLTFIAYGFLARRAGPMVPGGILTGLGAGLIAALDVLPATNTGGMVTLGLGIGFLLVTPLARATSGEAPLWPLAPGAVLSFVGVALLVGGVARDLLRLSGAVLWPALLILAGLALLLGAYARNGRTN